MAENKQYITQTQENGSVMISEEVIATIVSHAVTDVEGVVSIGGGKTNLERKLLNKGIKINISESNDISVDCSVVVAYGSSVVTVANAVQEAAFGAVEAMTGIKPASVNVNVSGIIRQ